MDKKIGPNKGRKFSLEWRKNLSLRDYWKKFFIDKMSIIIEK